MAKFKRMLAMFLVMVMLVSALPMQALAADGTVTENETVVDGNVKTEVQTQTTTSTDEATGKVTVEVKFTESTTGTNDNGAKVEGKASGESKTVSDSEGKVQESSSKSESSSTTSKETTNEKGETTKEETKVESKSESSKKNGVGSSSSSETTTNTTKTTNDKGETIKEDKETTKVETKSESNEKTEANGNTSTTEKTTTTTNTTATNGKGEVIGEKTEVTQSETKSESKVDTKEETGADGSTTTTETKTETTTGSSSTTNEGGMEIANGSLNSTETTTDTTVVAPDGTTTQQTVVEGSSKEESWTNDVKGPDVNVTIQYEKNEDGSLKLDDNGDPIPMKDKDGNIIISGSVHEENTVPNGEKPQEGDEEYDYSETTTTTDRVVTGTLKQEQSFEINGLDSTLECPVGPEDYEGKQQPTTNDGGANGKNHNYEGLTSGNDIWIREDYDGLIKPKPDGEDYDDGFDLTWTGSGDSTSGAAAVVIRKLVPQYNADGTIKYETDKDGNYKLDVNGERIPVIDWEKSEFANGTNKAVRYDEEGRTYLVNEKGQAVDEDGNLVAADKRVYLGSGMVLSPSQFALEHVNGNYFYAYCMDAATGAQPTVNKWYYISNLEDAVEGNSDTGYLTEAEAALIRAITTKGYWGTDANVYETDAEGNILTDENDKKITKKDEDGNIVTDSSVRGSVASLKALLEETYGTDGTVSLHYPGSNQDFGEGIPVSTLIAGLTESEALAATQAAIWAIANKNDVIKGKTAVGIVGVLSAIKMHNGSETNPSWIQEYQSAYNVLTNYSGNASKDFFNGETVDAQKYLESDIRMQALYQALLGLEPIYADGELREDSMVIPNENVISDVALVIKDKDEYHKDNKDNNKDNDVYNTAVNFKLAFVPGEKDEMYVVLMDSKNQPIVGEDGKPIKKLLAAEGSTKTGNDVIKPVDGVYTLTGLKLSENSPFEFDLKLEGTQYLNEGVYIYQAMGKDGVPTRGASQTLVGLAKGEQKVVVHNVMTVEFNVDEEQSVVATRVWREVSDPVVTPPEEPEEEPEEEEEEEEPEENGDTPAPANWIAPQNNRLANNTVEIAEEPVPLAAPVLTGDNTIIWIAFAMMIAFAMVAINIFDKKRNYETF